MSETLINFHEIGKRTAKESSNSLDALHIQLESILSHHEKNSATENRLKTEKKKELETSIKEIESSINNLEKEKEVKEKKISDIEEYIEILQNAYAKDSDTLNETPTNVDSDTDQPQKSEKSENEDSENVVSSINKSIDKKKTKKLRFIERITETAQESRLVRFLIASCLLILVLPLWSFYSSAFYSVYIRNVSKEALSTYEGYKPTKTTDISILKLDAFEDVWSKSWEEAIFGTIFIGGLPFIFVVVIFAIFIIKRKYFKNTFLRILLIYIGVLLFDILLAFQIVREIQITKGAEKLLINPGVQTISLLDILEVVPDVRFWILLFTGFGSYFMLGFILDFYIGIHDRIAEAKNKLAAQKREVNELVSTKLKEIDKTYQQISEIDKKITENIGKKNVIKQKIDSIEEHINVNPKIVKHDVINCIKGWLNHVNVDPEHSPGSTKYRNEQAQKCKELMDQFLEKIKKYNHNGEHI